jgi:PAS domain S-box-containing protein
MKDSGEDLLQSTGSRDSVKDDLEKLAMYENLVHHAGIGIGYWDINGNLLIMNKCGADRMGMDPSEMIGKNMVDLFGEELGRVYSERIGKSLDSDEHLVFEDEILMPTGMKQFFRSTYKCIRDASGNPQGVHIFSEDLTAEKEMDEKKEETRRRMEWLLEGIPDCVYVHDFKGNIVMVNEASVTSLGYSRAELMRKNIWDLDPNIITEKHKQEIWLKLERGDMETIRTFHVSKEGREIPMEVRLSLNELDGKDIIIAIARNIKDRIRLEERMKSFLDSSPDISFVKDRDLNYILVNQAYLRYFDLEEKDVIGRKDHELLKGNLAGQCRVSDLRAIETGEMIISEEMGEGKSFLETRKFPVRIDDNEFGVGGIIRDITEKRLAEISVKEEMERAELYLDLLGHDICNLHQGILTGMQIMTGSERGSSNYEVGRRSVEGLIKRSMKLVSDVQFISRLRETELDLREVDLGEMMHEIPTRFKDRFPAKDLDVELVCPGECSSVLAEPMVEYLFSNLIHNAVKFQDGKARVRITGEVEDGYMRIEIQDWGPGISDDMKENIFGRFVVHGNKGRTGLGLSIVRALVDRYNGRILVRDRVEGDHTRGASFVVWLPLAREELK